MADCILAETDLSDVFTRAAKTVDILDNLPVILSTIEFPRREAEDKMHRAALDLKHKQQHLGTLHSFAERSAALESLRSLMVEDEKFYQAKVVELEAEAELLRERCLKRMDEVERVFQ